MNKNKKTNQTKSDSSKIINFGETIKGYKIPVLNEREIRASAGIFFVLILVALMIIIFKEDFLLIKYVITAFVIDFAIRIFINPKFSPTLIIGRFIVNNQTPEYVGAAQKRFAWIVGLILASIMFVLMVLLNSYSVITGLICLACLIFLLFESAFGICLACLFYNWVYKEKAQYCPGEICEAKVKQDIQKINGTQICIVIGYVLLILIVVLLFNNYFSKTPIDLWTMIKPLLSK